jgi:hypothetical protein
MGKDKIRGRWGWIIERKFRKNRGKEETIINKDELQGVRKVTVTIKKPAHADKEEE